MGVTEAELEAALVTVPVAPVPVPTAAPIRLNIVGASGMLEVLLDDDVADDAEDDVARADDAESAVLVRPPNTVAGARTDDVAPKAEASGMGLPPPKGVGRAGVDDPPPKAVVDPNVELPNAEVPPNVEVVDPNVVEEPNPSLFVWDPKVLPKVVGEDPNPLPVTAPNPLVVVVDPNLVVEPKGVDEMVEDVEVGVVEVVLLISEVPKAGAPFLNQICV